MAVSQSVQVDRVITGVRLVGPGWVFFEPAIKKSYSWVKTLAIFLIFFLYSLIFDYV